MSSHGVHRRHSYSIRLNPLPWAATPLLLSLAFFACLILTALPARTHLAANQLAASYRAAHAAAPAAHAAKHLSPPQESSRMYTVRPGDSLSLIAANVYGAADYWTAIYWRNHGEISSPDLILAGQRFVIPPRPASPPAAPAVPAPAPVTASYSSPGTAPPSGGTYSGPPGTFQACVISRESGGNPQIWNASRHYGLYQFSYDTWVAAGGDPALFGNASADYQNQVFDWAYAKWGVSPWAPYDGC